MQKRLQCPAFAILLKFYILLIYDLFNFYIYNKLHIPLGKRPLSRRSYRAVAAFNGSLDIFLKNSKNPSQNQSSRL